MSLIYGEPSDAKYEWRANDESILNYMLQRINEPRDASEYPTMAIVSSEFARGIYFKSRPEATAAQFEEWLASLPIIEDDEE